MSRTGRFVTPLLLAPLLFALFTPASPAAARSPSHGEHPGEHARRKKDVDIVRETVNWSMSPEQCVLLQSPLSGTGQREMHIESSTRQDGTVYRVTKDVVVGTATDSSGSYRFVYRNRLEETIPPGGAPIQVHMTDSFNLVGRRSPDIDVAFDWTWSYSPPAESWPPGSDLQKAFTKGDVNCDPI